MTTGLKLVDTARRSLPVESRYVVAGDRAPERLRGIVELAPALDAGEETFDARSISGDAISIPQLTKARTVWTEDGNQVLGAGKDVDIGFLTIEILREPSIRSARDVGISHIPPETVGSVPAARIIAESKRRSEPGSARAERKRNRQRAGTRHRVRRELLPDSLDCTTALGQQHRGRRKTLISRLVGGPGFRRAHNGKRGRPSTPRHLQDMRLSQRFHIAES